MADHPDDREQLFLQPYSTIQGFLEHVMIHESLSPLKNGWDKNQTLTAMRMMRQVIENRSHAPKWFKASGHKPGAETEIAVLRAPGQYGAFANAPHFPQKFIAPVNYILEAANNPKSKDYEDCRTQVKNAIKAATESAVPADVANPRLYYWRTAGTATPAGKHGEMQKHIHLFKTIQGKDFYEQDNLKVTQ